MNGAWVVYSYDWGISGNWVRIFDDELAARRAQSDGDRVMFVPWGLPLVEAEKLPSPEPAT